MRLRVTWLQTPSPRRRGFQRYHVSHDSDPHLLIEESSDAATHLVTLCGPQASSVEGVAIGSIVHLRLVRSRTCMLVLQCR
jgi:hypothetical protein